MGELVKLFKGSKITTAKTIEKIREGNIETLLALYYHTNSDVEKALIEMIFEIKGWQFLDEPEEPRRA